jgi:DNA-binding GntR family transcriptional regulator
VNEWNELIETQVMAIRIACGQLTAPHLKALRDSVEQACCVPATFGWNRKAAAHAEIFNVLADAVRDPLLACELSGGVGLAYHLTAAASRGVAGLIACSRRRLLGHLAAGDGEAAALEMEQHLRTLRFLWRLNAGRAHRTFA